MTIDPRTESEIEDDLQSSLSGKIDALTNFIAGTFNRLWIQAFASELHEIEVRLLAAQLSGWVDYSGDSDLQQDDLDRLGVDGATPSEVNQYMQDSHLNELGKIVGQTRSGGEKANGDVTIQTATNSTQVIEGLEVATQPDATGDYLSYFVDVDDDGTIEDGQNTTTPSSNQEVTVPIIAAENGEEYNQDPGSITYLPNPDPGIEGVNNATEVTGGLDEQSNESLRNDITNAVFVGSGGGTTAGIRGYISDNVDGVVDVAIDEFYSQQPPYVDVIVDGGAQAEVETAISESRPTGIEHIYVEPDEVQIGAVQDLVGSDIDTSFVESTISSFLTDLSLDEELYKSQLIRTILDADNDIVDIGSLALLIVRVVSETHTYSNGTNIYELNYEPIGSVFDDEFMYDSGTDVYRLAYDDVNTSSVEVTATVDRQEVTLTQGTDYDVVDDSGNGNPDAIDFSAGGDNPDNRTPVDVEYTHESWSIDSEITDSSGDTYDQGVDWSLIDNDSDGRMDSIDWSIGGATPDDSEEWSVSYDPKLTINEDLVMSKREKVTGSNRVETTVYSDTL